MNNKSILSKVFFLAILIYISQIYSQEKFPPNKDLKGSSLTTDERFEGIRQFEDVSIGQLRLKATIVNYEEQLPENVEHFTIGFYIDESIQSNDIDILMEDKMGKSYYMIPVRRHWNIGFGKFQWNSSFANSYGIELYDLYAKIEVKKPGLVNTIVPVMLFYNKIPIEIKAYKFVFTSTKQVTLKYAIYDEQYNEVISGLLRYQPKNTEIEFLWHCGDADAGQYQLLVDYTLIGEGRVEEFSDTYEFYHIKTPNY